MYQELLKKSRYVYVSLFFEIIIIHSRYIWLTLFFPGFFIVWWSDRYLNHARIWLASAGNHETYVLETLIKPDISYYIFSPVIVAGSVDIGLLIFSLCSPIAVDLAQIFSCDILFIYDSGVFYWIFGRFWEVIGIQELSEFKHTDYFHYVYFLPLQKFWFCKWYWCRQESEHGANLAYLFIYFLISIL